MLEKLADALDALPDWNHDACDAASRGVAAAEGVKAGVADQRDARRDRGPRGGAAAV